MSERKQILEFFEQQQDFLNTTVAENIEKYRKGDCVLQLTDQNGNPIKNAQVQIKQKTSEFKFGANLFMLDGMETEEKNEKYKQSFTQLFNMATLPFYWNTLEPEEGKLRYEKGSPYIYRRPDIDSCIEFCQENGIEPREHALAFDSFFPSWLKGKPTTEVKEKLEKRFQEISERYADKIPTIEVTNEMLWKGSVTDFYFEPDYVDWCFKTADKYFPNNQLCINESSDCIFLDWSVGDHEYCNYLDKAITSGVPIDAIGLQFHMFFKREDEYKITRRPYNPKEHYSILDKYGKYNLPMQITEITIPAYSYDPQDEEIQAIVMEYLYTLWFSYPNMQQIIYWNLVDGYAYVADPSPENIKKSQGNMTLGENYYYGGLFRFDLSPKPAYLKLQDLILKKWRTNETLTSDANGKIIFRGFHGDYEITVNGKQVPLTISSKDKQTNKTIVL